MSKEHTSHCVYKADLEVTVYRNDPLERSTNVIVTTISSSDIKELPNLIDEHIKNHSHIRLNCFSSLLFKESVKVLRVYKSIETDISIPKKYRIKD